MLRRRDLGEPWRILLQTLNEFPSKVEQVGLTPKCNAIEKRTVLKHRRMLASRLTSDKRKLFFQHHGDHERWMRTAMLAPERRICWPPLGWWHSDHLPIQTSVKNRDALRLRRISVGASLMTALQWRRLSIGGKSTCNPCPGEAVGRGIEEFRFPHRHLSIAARGTDNEVFCSRSRIPNRLQLTHRYLAAF